MTFSNYSFTWMIRIFLLLGNMFLCNMLHFENMNWSFFCMELGIDFINVSKLNLFCEESIWFWLFFVGPKTGFKFLLKVFFLVAKVHRLGIFCVVCGITWNYVEALLKPSELFPNPSNVVLILKLEVFE